MCGEKEWDKRQEEGVEGKEKIKTEVCLIGMGY